MASSVAHDESFCPDGITPMYLHGPIKKLLPTNHMGYIPTRAEMVRIIAGLEEWYKSVSDEDIADYNERQKHVYGPLPLVKKPKYKPVRSRNPRPGFIYIIRAGVYYKIGLSATPDIRLRAIANDLKVPVSVEHTIFVSDMRAAEQFLHDRFDALRRLGEWFELTPSDLFWIKSKQTLEGLY